MTTTAEATRTSQHETAEEALARITQGFSENDVAAIMAFAGCGVPPEEITPRENVLTFKAWKAKGRRVAKGAIGQPVRVWVPSKRKRKDDEGNEKPAGMYPKTTYLFHISQTIPKEAPKGTPVASDNPALFRQQEGGEQ